MYLLNEEIGKRIVGLRKAHHMTQEELAERLNISIKHCSCVERGVSSMSMDLFIDVCDVFDVSLDYLIRGRTENCIDRIPQTFLEIVERADDRELDILREYLRLYSKIKSVSTISEFSSEKGTAPSSFSN